MHQDELPHRIEGNDFPQRSTGRDNRAHVPLGNPGTGASGRRAEVHVIEKISSEPRDSLHRAGCISRIAEAQPADRTSVSAAARHTWRGAGHGL